MTDDTKAPFTVIDGGKAAPKRGPRTGKTESGLTVKQEAYAQGLASGLSNADAYRAAYDSSGMKPSVIHNEASRLALRPDIAARVNAIVSETKRKNSMLSDRAAMKHSERVWRGVWRLAESENVPPAVQQSALALAAKMAGMLTDKVEIENKTGTSDDIEKELRERLKKLSA